MSTRSRNRAHRPHRSRRDKIKQRRRGTSTDSPRDWTAQPAPPVDRCDGETIELDLYEFEVTDEPMHDPYVAKLSRSVRDQIETITIDAVEHGRVGDHLEELETLVERYPHIPRLHNLLATACEARGQIGRARAVVEDTADRFPDYVFGVANRIRIRIVDGRLDEAAELLDGRFVIAAFAPHRRRFHKSEFISYQTVVAQYLEAIGKHEEAIKQLDMLLEMNPEHPMVQRLMRIMSERMVKQAFGKLTAMVKGKAAGRQASQAR
jgi:tetratricopeptide (TPR) repeat protein